MEIVNASETDRDPERVASRGRVGRRPDVHLLGDRGPGGRACARVHERGAQDWGGLSFGRGTAIWSNSEPDTAGLFDGAGMLVSFKVG